MYKITHKETGFSQYRNSKDAANFIYKNKKNKYNIKKIKQYDFTEIQDVLMTMVLMIFVFVFFYFLLWTFY